MIAESVPPGTYELHDVERVGNLHVGRFKDGMLRRAMLLTEGEYFRAKKALASGRSTVTVAR